MELKAELTKRGKSTTGLKAVLLERLKDAIANSVVIVANTPGATTTTPDDLRGFAETACWKPLVPMETVVEEPTNRVSTLHAPTVPPGNASFLPQKLDFAEEFDCLPFVGKEKIPKFHCNGRPVMKDGKQVFTEQFNSKGGPKAEFIQDNKLVSIQHPKIGLMLSYLFTMEQVASQNERRQDASLTSGLPSPTRRPFKWELGYKVDVIQPLYPSATKKLNDSWACTCYRA